MLRKMVAMVAPNSITAHQLSLSSSWLLGTCGEVLSRDTAGFHLMDGFKRLLATVKDTCSSDDVHDLCSVLCVVGMMHCGARYGGYAYKEFTFSGVRSHLADTSACIRKCDK